MGENAQVYLSGLTCYPVKSCAGVPQQAARLVETGLEHDRSFLVVRPDGTGLTQRERPELAVVQPALGAQRLTLSVPSGASWSVDLAVPTGEPLPVEIWGDEVTALDQGDDIAALLSAHLGEPVRLARIDPGAVRQVPGREGTPVGFADAYPLLLAGESSLAELNRRLPVALPMNRFRPNLVVTGAEPFAEDHWRLLRIGDVALEVAKPCARCAITTVDQATGRRDGAEPLRTLGTFRRGTKGVEFAMNVVHRGPGWLHVGDSVERI